METPDEAETIQSLSFDLDDQVMVNSAYGKPLYAADDQLSSLSRQWIVYATVSCAAFVAFGVILFVPIGGRLVLHGDDRALVSIVWAGSFYLLGFCLWQLLQLRHLRAEVGLIASLNEAAIGHARELAARITA